jgi:hypothetical protein
MREAALARQIEHENDPLVSTFQAYFSLFARWLRVSPLHPFYALFATAKVKDQLCFQQFIDTSDDPPKDVVFSIRPPHVENILAGTKTVELRRRFSRTVKVGTRALIYSTTPHVH